MISKATVHYREGTAAKHCGNCSMYRDHRCTLVSGLIEPRDVCDRWEPKERKMADLTANTRKHLSSSTFGLPGQRKYPMPDRSHAANAKARATQQYNAGRLSGSQRAEIDRKADAKLGKAHHALSIASATHLHNAGHLPAAQAARIKAKAKAAMGVGNNSYPGVHQQTHAFGSLAPDSDGGW